MGNTLSAVPDKMQDNQKQMMLAQREMMMATQVGKMRDDFMWLSAFQGTILTLCTIGAIKTHNPRLMIPWVPMGFSWAYMRDACYGNKFDRVVANAEEILRDKNQRAMFILPEGNRMMSKEEYARRIIGETFDLSSKIGGGNA